MKYCMNFLLGKPYINEVDEVIINSTDNYHYQTFLREHENQRVVIKVPNMKALIESINLYDVFSALKDKNFNNFTVLLPQEAESEKYITPLKENNIPFFFDRLLQSWTELCYYVDLGVSDVYITNDLGFDIEAVGEFCHRTGVKVRAFPNFAQRAVNNRDVHSFFIRPEDTKEYEEYIDVYEFVYRISNIEQSTYYKIYAKDRQWFGDLKEIIIGLEQEIDNRGIVKQFSIYRKKCQLKCQRLSHCHICESCLFLSEKLLESGQIIDNSKKI